MGVTTHPPRNEPIVLEIRTSAHREEDGHPSPAPFPSTPPSTPRIFPFRKHSKPSGKTKVHNQDLISFSIIYLPSINYNNTLTCFIYCSSTPLSPSLQFLLNPNNNNRAIKGREEHGMEIPKFYNKIRFFPNPNFLFSHFFTSQSISICSSSFFTSQSISICSSSSKTLISSLNSKHSFMANQKPYFRLANLIHLGYFLFSFRSTPFFLLSQYIVDHRNIGCSCSRPYSTSGSYSDKSREKSDFEGSSKGFRGKNSKPKVSAEQIREIVEVIRREGDNVEGKLNGMNISISFDLVEVIFRHLNDEGVSGLCFFLWVRTKQTDFNRSSEFCSLVIDNLGRIRAYEMMLILLKDFSKETLCLTERAFGFLQNAGSGQLSIRDGVKIVTMMLNEVGGSCRNSGVHALMKMLCILNKFELAYFVMEEMGRKTSYYNVLIWAKCGRIDFQEARCLLDEMRSFGCEPDENSFCYLLSSLCKNGRVADACSLLEVMEEFGIQLNAVAFETFIICACSLGRLDFAIDFINQMISRGIEPRYTTHAILIKGYFYDRRFQEAYKYVVDMSEKYKCSANVNYSLLATLLQRSRRVTEAREILVDMMEKGLKPHFPVYMKVMKDLNKSGMGSLVADLKSRFSKFT